jgi:CRP-like cAMP-binding protein
LRAESQDGTASEYSHCALCILQLVSDSMGTDALGILKRNVQIHLDLTSDEVTAIERLPVQLSQIARGEAIVREGDQPETSFLLVNGFACTYKVSGSGERQIMAVHVPGDLPDLQSLHVETLDAGVFAASACEIAHLRHTDLNRLCLEYPRISAVLWRMTLIDAAIFKEWVLNVGRRSAIQRLAHLICEIYLRLERIGLAEEGTCSIPLTQVDLADCTGLSSVHLNRSMQELRRRKLVRWEGKTVEIPNWKSLAVAGDFDPTFLHLKPSAGWQCI